MRIARTLESWARGASLALTLAALSSKAIAQGVIHTVPPSPLFYSDLPSSQNIDVNNDGTPDFTLVSPNGIEIDLIPLNNSGILAVPELPPDLGGFVYALPSGRTISSSLDPGLVWFDRTYPGGTTFIVACANIGCVGYFQGNTDAYAGIRLESNGDYFYGWLHIQNFGANWGQISEWAYQSNPNTPIFAGQVPEPSALSLLSVGLLLLARKFRAAFK